jgi:glycosyltransferase involved in cell wall biosynthesis
MKILQICFRMPYPLKDGGAIAMHNISQGLADSGAELSLLVPLTKKHNVGLNHLPDEIKKLGHITTQQINSEITTIGAFINLFSSKAYYLSRYYSKRFKNKLIELLKSGDFDIIIIESLKVSMYVDVIREYSNARLIYRSHNVEHLIWSRLSHEEKGLKKFFLQTMVRRLKNFEEKNCRHFDLIAPITDVDAAFYKKHAPGIPVITTPSGIDFSRFTPKLEKVRKNSLFHLGALDWLPNQEAVKWFVHEVWPAIYQKHPDLMLNVAGRNIPHSLKSLQESGVNMIGEVEDAQTFINENQIMIVPLKSGSGMRIKVVEGMALGKCIISTRIGAEGIEYTHGKNILIADTAEEFCQQVDLLRSNPDLISQIGQQAISFVREKYDNKAIIANLLQHIKELPS